MCCYTVLIKKVGGPIDRAGESNTKADWGNVQELQNSMYWPLCWRKLVSYCTKHTVYGTRYGCNDTSRQKLSSSFALQALATACDMFTGAELAGLCREAAITALREDLQVQDTYLLLT